MPREAFTVNEIAAALGVGHIWVRRRIRAGALQARQFGRGANAKWLITKSALKKFIQQAKVIENE